MSTITRPSAIVLHGGYNEDSRKIPALAFIEQAQKHVEGRDPAGYEELHRENLTFHSTHGELTSHDGGYHDGHTWMKSVGRYYTGPLEDQENFADKVVVFEDEKDDHVSLIWKGTLYADVRGKATDGEEKAKDPNGREWV